MNNIKQHLLAAILHTSRTSTNIGMALKLVSKKIK
jgi:hypothetical protein